MAKLRSAISLLAVTTFLAGSSICPISAYATKSSTRKQPSPQLKAETPKAGLPSPSRDPKVQTGKQAISDPYPVISQLETITFGFARKTVDISERLNQLEMAIFHQTFPNLPLIARSEKLKDTLLGAGSRSSVSGSIPDGGWFNGEEIGRSALPTGQGVAGKGINPQLIEQWKQPFYQAQLPLSELERFALETVNQERKDTGLNPLQWDDLSYKVATAQVADLCHRDTVSHLNQLGENPDVRYTKSGGSDALTESLVTVSGEDAKALNRALVARMIEQLKSHQDDRDALMSPDATHFGFSLGNAKSSGRAIGCAEIITKHGIMHPIPSAVTVGEKIQVKGVLLQPYKLQKLTLAWEGTTPETAESSMESEEAQDEAMPYFPPLDYLAYGEHAEHDREKIANVLRMTGVIAAIAGGVFIPPVALAAPLIAMAPSGGEPRAAADVPVHGGIKMQGSLFNLTAPINNHGKEGMYYITVWASVGEASRLVPISRRVIVAKTAEHLPMANDEKEQKGETKVSVGAKPKQKVEVSNQQ